MTPKLPIYSGGLGILAGDFIKAVGDLKLPIVGVGIFWNEGYTQQTISSDGRPVDDYPPTSRELLDPVDVDFSVQIDGRDVPLQAYLFHWQEAGTLYLIEPRDDDDKHLTRRLYGDGEEARVRQEVILGIGAVRLLQAIGRKIDLFHLNEGHALFAAHELIHQAMEQGNNFDEARAEVRDKIVFTTHTPVPAGNEKHEVELIVSTGGGAGLTSGQLKSIGGEPFCMTTAALRLCKAANAVAELHNRTAAEMWKHVDGAAEIVGITNGVHRGTWQSTGVRDAVEAGDKDALWQVHQAAKSDLLEEIQERNGVKLRSDSLVIGFARRAAPYKRGDLLFQDSERLKTLIEQLDVQFVFSGKAHPLDTAGKEIVKNIVEASSVWPQNVVFIENYDMTIGAMLTRGCDVWLNTPRPPQEACGTSGMKAAMNGVLNVSVLDGWWAEMCEHDVNGWRIPAVDASAPVEVRDERDRSAIFDVIEEFVAPAYGDRSRWLDMMTQSVKASQEQFSSARMVKDYCDQLYS